MIVEELLYKCPQKMKLIETLLYGPTKKIKIE